MPMPKIYYQKKISFIRFSLQQLFNRAETLFSLRGTDKTIGSRAQKDPGIVYRNVRRRYTSTIHIFITLQHKICCVTVFFFVYFSFSLYTTYNNILHINAEPDTAPLFCFQIFQSHNVFVAIIIHLSIYLSSKTVIQYF